MIFEGELHAENKEIIDHYGMENQMGQLIEECAELIHALSKLRRAKGSPLEAEWMSDVKMEIVDVLVVLDQVLGEIRLHEDEIEVLAKYKINRQQERIRHESA